MTSPTAPRWRRSVARWSGPVWPVLVVAALLTVEVRFLAHSSWRPVVLYDGDSLTLPILWSALVHGEAFHPVLSPQLLVFPEAVIYALARLCTTSVAASLVAVAYGNIALLYLGLRALATVVVDGSPQRRRVAAVVPTLLLIAGMLLERVVGIDGTTIATPFLFDSFYAGVIIVGVGATAFAVRQVGAPPGLSRRRRRAAGASATTVLALTVISDPLFLVQITAPLLFVVAVLCGLGRIDRHRAARIAGPQLAAVVAYLALMPLYRRHLGEAGSGYVDFRRAGPAYRTLDGDLHRILRGGAGRAEVALLAAAWILGLVATVAQWRRTTPLRPPPFPAPDQSLAQGEAPSPGASPARSESRTTWQGRTRSSRPRFFRRSAGATGYPAGATPASAGATPTPAGATGYIAGRRPGPGGPGESTGDIAERSRATGRLLASAVALVASISILPAIIVVGQGVPRYLLPVVTFPLVGLVPAANLRRAREPAPEGRAVRFAPVAVVSVFAAVTVLGVTAVPGAAAIVEPGRPPVDARYGTTAGESCLEAAFAGRPVSGVASYWTARALDVNNGDGQRILQVKRDLTIFPWLVNLGAYEHRHFTFVLVDGSRHAQLTMEPGDVTRLGPPGRVVACPGFTIDTYPPGGAGYRRLNTIIDDSLRTDLQRFG